jgi:hypothetical protein
VSEEVLGCEGHINLIREIDELVPVQGPKKNVGHRVGSDVELKKAKCKIM